MRSKNLLIIQATLAPFICFILGACNSNSISPLAPMLNKVNQTQNQSSDPANPLPILQIQPTPTGTPYQATYQDHWWLEKASRALRGGTSLLPTESADALLANGREQAVNQLIADPRFGDSMLDFSAMYLGFREDAIKDLTGVYLASSFYLAPAILASQEVAKNGNFFRIFDKQQGVYLPPLKRPRSTDPADASLSDSALREKVMAAMQTELDRIIAMASLPTPVNSDICSAYENYFLHYINNDQLSLHGSVPTELLIVSDFYGSAFNFCYSGMKKPFDFVAALQTMKAKNELLFAAIRTFAAETYHPTVISDLKPLDFSGFAATYDSSLFTSTLMLKTIPNSSTNYDRKRSAYVLKRFLCDDLTPVNVENPSAHVGDPHGSNPSCFACHYKLDPMAGFFRFHGLDFLDFSQSDRIIFDDGAEMKIGDYVKAWAGTDANHPLNVGYIRSTQKTNTNFYGSTLDDLMGFLKTAPEAKRCLVKRAYEYLVSDEQTLDGAYLDYLTNQFIATEATQGSGVALKNTFKTIVLGQAFGTQNADHDQCYDHVPGFQEKQNSVPCKVASILNVSCVKCHSSTSGSGSLDLSHWQKMADGSFGFPHLNADGSAIPAAKTFQSILDRLSSTDSDTRMPYLSDMASQDRQQLYVWLNQALTTGTK